MTAREDQPQLGTCKYWPFLQHAQDMCCVDWKPVTEDQPSPTPQNCQNDSNLITQLGKYFTGEMTKGEAHGEAPPKCLHCEELTKSLAWAMWAIGRMPDANGKNDEYIANHKQALELIRKWDANG